MVRKLRLDWHGDPADTVDLTHSQPAHYVMYSKGVCFCELRN